MLAFEPETHTYKYNGKIVPSVTQIMSRVGVRENEDAHFNPVSGGFFLKDDTASDFGTALHTVAEAKVLGKNVLFDMQMQPWVNGIEMFLKDHGNDIEVQETEQMYYSKLYGYCGTWDLGGLYKNEPFTLDWKSCTQMPKTAKIQTAAYEELRVEMLGIKKKGHRWAVMIGEDSYKIEKRNKLDKVDMGKFISLLNVYKSFSK